jgi:uncharacterized membrane-anchored protein YjiN (DUF445 family)
MEQVKSQVDAVVETTQKTSVDDEVKFTQRDLNAILKRGLSKETEKLTKEVSQYKKQYDELISSQKQHTLKDTFVKNGGIAERFNDFAKLNDEIINKDMKDFDSEVRKTIEKQPYLFNQELVKDNKVNDKNDKEKETLPLHFPF